MDTIDLSQWLMLFPENPDVSIDSRTIRSPRTLFIALQGRRGDGHKYVERALNEGALYALVDREYKAPASVPESRLIRVASPLHSLQSLAQHYRNSIPNLLVIAVAGSCGKTMLKDLMGHLLSPHRLDVYTSPESFNSPNRCRLKHSSYAPLYPHRLH